MSKLDDFLGIKEVCPFTNGWYVINQKDCTREEALDLFNQELDGVFSIHSVKSRWVRYQYGSYEDCEEDYCDSRDRARWWILYRFVKGAKPVWVINI